VRNGFRCPTTTASTTSADVQDKRFEDDGELDFSQGVISPIGRLGDEILVNGTHDPHVEITDERVRFRLLNASTARIYDIGVADERPFELIGTDGGLMEKPQTVRRVTLSPADRIEIVAEFEPGETAVLRSFEPELGTDFFNERFIGGDDNLDLLEVRAAETLDRSPEIPARLARAEPLDEGDASRVRESELSGSSSINGESFDMGRIDEIVESGAIEVWEVKNGSGIPHSFHPHGVRFRVLEIAGGPPPPQLSGWEDTVLIQPNERARLLIGFEEYADPASPYMFHCHILEHEDRGMMGQMVVVEPGQEPQPPHDAHDR
jgi:FtsP/CotA-like multicopper oxidase with cupredoxin domain